MVESPRGYEELGMIEPDEAATIIANERVRTATEEVPLTEGVGRFLNTPLPARLTLPRFDKAAVDGIGIGPRDASTEFRLVGTIAAGDEGVPTISPGECIKIMTGAPVPPGVDRVVRFEYTRSWEDDGETIFRIVREESGANIAWKGENINPGDELLTPRRLTGVDIGIAASHGYAVLPVARPVRVVIVATGSELTPPGEPLADAAIYDGNSYQLAAMAESAGAAVVRTGIVPDDRDLLRRRLDEALTDGEIVVVSGGVSMGELDYVPSTLESLGVETGFHGLAMKPGRPTYFGRRGETVVFGLPGNPVSTAVQFELFITPLIRRRMGVPCVPREGFVTLAHPFRRKNADRHEYRPGTVDIHNRVTMVPYKGSGHVAALAAANALIRVDRGVAEIAEGETVYARYIR
ncbi:MAG: gephyrin-like molybdotransferase Glp [Alkalispirochaeta sp.]